MLYPDKERAFKYSLAVRPDNTRYLFRQATALLRDYIYSELRTCGKVHIQSLFALTVHGNLPNGKLPIVRAKLGRPLKVACLTNGSGWTPNIVLPPRLLGWFAKKYPNRSATDRNQLAASIIYGIMLAMSEGDYHMPKVVKLIHLPNGNVRLSVDSAIYASLKLNKN